MTAVLRKERGLSRWAFGARRRITAARLPIMVLALCWSLASTAAPQASDELERVVILSRHGVRSAMTSPEELGRFTALPWPRFSAPPGHLTQRGAALLTILGTWYRQRYEFAGLLRRGDCSVYYWANHTQRTIATAKALGAGLTPDCEVEIHRSAQEPDPLFDAPLTVLAPPNPPRLLAAISTRVGGNLAAWDTRQQPQLDKFEALLLQCARFPCSPKERGKVERRLTDTPVTMGLDAKGGLQLTSPALSVGSLAESLVMAYADGLEFPGWRGIDARTIGEALAVHGAAIDLRTRTPEVGRQSSSYLAMRLLATLQRAARIPVLADPIGGDEKIILLAGHDGTLTMLAGLLGLNWRISSYAAGEAAPGGALVFELWRRGADGQHVVRVHYVAQTLDQLRRLAPLSLAQSPAMAAIAVPGCGDAAAGCELSGFTRHVLQQVLGPGQSRVAKAPIPRFATARAGKKASNGR